MKPQPFEKNSWCRPKVFKTLSQWHYQGKSGKIKSNSDKYTLVLNINAFEDAPYMAQQMVAIYLGWA